MDQFNLPFDVKCMEDRHAGGVTQNFGSGSGGHHGQELTHAVISGFRIHHDRADGWSHHVSNGSDQGVSLHESVVIADAGEALFELRVHFLDDVLGAGEAGFTSRTRT